MHMAKYTRIHRLLEIISLIQAQRGWTAKALSEKCETSERNIYRDIDQIREACIPVEAGSGDEGYRINGAKTYISNGQTADFIIVVAKTDPNERAKGISLMLLETEGAEGFQRGKKLDKVGMDAADTSELFFDDVFVPAENVLGGEEGKGFYQLMGELPQERLIIAMGAMTGIEKALEVTMEFVKNRKAFGQTIWDFQNTQFVLADLNARGTAARVFVNDCIAKHLKGELDVPTACMAKYMVTELQGEVVDKCLQFHGGAGFINDYPIARMYRDSRITRIFGGSNEVMKMVIARSM